MAFPFLTGFYSKDFLLEIALVPINITSSVAYLFAFLAAILTATYSSRLLILSFFSAPHFPKVVLNTIHDPTSFMYIPLFLLGLGAAFFGYLTNDLFLGMGNTFYLQSLFFHPANIGLLDGSFSSSSLKYLPLVTLLLLLTLLPLSYSNSFRSPSPLPLPSLYLVPTALNQFNTLYWWLLINILSLSSLINRYLDRGLFELFGPFGLIRFFHYYAFKLELLATAFIPHYAFIIILSIISLFFLAFFL